MMASIFIPLSFMTGLYGMNFENMPELRIRWSYPALLAVMLLTALGILLYVRAHALPCGQHAPRSAPPAALRLRFRYSRTRVRSVPVLGAPCWAPPPAARIGLRGGRSGAVNAYCCTTGARGGWAADAGVAADVAVARACEPSPWPPKCMPPACRPRSVIRRTGSDWRRVCSASAARPPRPRSPPGRTACPVPRRRAHTQHGAPPRPQRR
jgi:hypothetical protein